jgi:hypothetical protein
MTLIDTREKGGPKFSTNLTQQMATLIEVWHSTKKYFTNLRVGVSTAPGQRHTTLIPLPTKSVAKALGITGVLNLGYANPLGVHDKLTGGMQNSKTTQKKLICVEFMIWGYAKGILVWFGGTHRGTIYDLEVRKGYTSLIWGYSERYNFDLEVRKNHKVENPYLP